MILFWYTHPKAQSLNPVFLLCIHPKAQTLKPVFPLQLPLSCSHNPETGEYTFGWISFVADSMNQKAKQKSWVKRSMSRHGMYAVESLRGLRTKCKVRPRPKTLNPTALNPTLLDLTLQTPDSTCQL
jgi:hypothetical protein